MASYNFEAWMVQNGFSTPGRPCVAAGTGQVEGEGEDLFLSSEKSDNGAFSLVVKSFVQVHFLFDEFQHLVIFKIRLQFLGRKQEIFVQRSPDIRVLFPIIQVVFGEGLENDHASFF